jgi:hypothetical protein
MSPRKSRDGDEPMIRWMVLLAVALSLGCGWEWNLTCEGILTTEFECVMICASERLDATWTPFDNSTQCGTCECDVPGGGGTTTPTTPTTTEPPT